MTSDPQQLLFELENPRPRVPQILGTGAVLLPGFAESEIPSLLEDVEWVAKTSPFRKMHTPGGKPMSTELTSCGRFGWISDRQGYRYSAHDPLDGRPWPPLPASFLRLAANAADRAGYPGFVPDSGLINRYSPGSKMSLHQDRDEDGRDAPIVSVSLGLPATFLWGGQTRGEPADRVALDHGDVVVFGGASRLRFHGIAPVAPGVHVATGSYRINLTFRKAR